MLISAGSDDIELLVVQGKIGNRDIRIFNCYGPQEVSQAQRSASEQHDVVSQFWIELENEIIKAKNDGCHVLIEMDANAKVGKSVLKDDPNEESANGKLLLDMVERQNLRILNVSEKCSGVITRQRVTVERMEMSVIDYIIGCDEIVTFLDEMMIDDERNYVLTKYATSNGFRKKVESDHNSLFARFILKYNTEREMKSGEKYLTSRKKNHRKSFMKPQTLQESLNLYWIQKEILKKMSISIIKP